MDPPGNEAAKRSKASRVRPELSCYRGNKVLHCRGALEAQEPRHAHGPGLADPPEVVAQHVHDHHVLGLVLAAREELAGQRPVLVPCPAPRARALDRIRADAALTVHREERLGRGRQNGSRRPGGRRRTEVQVPREQGRVAGPQPAEDGPRVPGEGGLQAAGEVRLVDLAPADGRPDGLHAVEPVGVGGPRHERRRGGLRDRRPRRAPDRGPAAPPGPTRPGGAAPLGSGAPPGPRPRPPRAPPARRCQCAGPTRVPSRGAPSASPGGAGPRAQSRAAARTAGPGRSPGSPRAHR